MEKEIRWKQRFQNFEKVFLFLKKGKELGAYDELQGAGLVQSFEFTFELAWKTLKDYLQEQGLAVQYPREIIKQSVLKKYPNIQEAILFGSRALDRYKKGSDIDIALKGTHIESVASEVSGILNDESPLPYVCDILDYHTIDNPDLKTISIG